MNNLAPPGAVPFGSAPFFLDKARQIRYNDANGNPTNYLGTAATWEKGRQLKSFGSNSYKYNNEGIRPLMQSLRH